MNVPTTFADFWRLGYTRLVPIVPPDAQISEHSSLLKRMDARGKAVGVRGMDGKWSGFNWLKHEATEDDLVRWQSMHAGIGCRTSQQFVLIDADTLSEERAGIIQDVIRSSFNYDRPIVRIGRYPKAGYPVRVKDETNYRSIEFGDLNEKGRYTERVEILAANRQFVAHGVHPVTLKQYEWPRGLPPLSELLCVTDEQLVGCLHELRKQFPASKIITSEHSDNAVSQASLKGDLAKVREAVMHIPNTSEIFPTRDSYLDIGYAIRASQPDNERAAFEIWQEWCERWDDPQGNDPDIVEADWRRMKPPYRRGAQWLYELAEKYSATGYTRAQAYFEEIIEIKSPFDETTDLNRFKEIVEPVKIDWRDPNDWTDAPPPESNWLIADMIPDGEVTLLTGIGGVGKTLLAQQMATCIANGIPFFSHEVMRGKVMMFLCEDSDEQLHRRQYDINRSLCLNMADSSPSLRIASRKFMDNLLSSWDRNTSQTKRTAVWKQLREDALAFGAKLVVIDTTADTFGGSEIDRAQVRQFVQAVCGMLAKDLNGAVLILAHPSKAGQSEKGDGTSGSTAWHASVRSRLYFKHANPNGVGDYRKLTTMKSNYGPSGGELTLRYHHGTFEVVSIRPVSQDDTNQPGPNGVAVTADVIDLGILDCVRMFEADKIPVSLARQSAYWAPKVMQATYPDTLGIYRIDDIAAGLQRMLTSKRIHETNLGKSPVSRHIVRGLAITKTEGDIFG